MVSASSVSNQSRSTSKRKQRIPYRSAKLNKVLANRFPVVHGVESCDFVDTHRGHLEQPGDFVHDTDAGPAVLALAQVEQGHDSGLFVLGRVAFKDLIDEPEVLFGEVERDARVVGGFVAVLETISADCPLIIALNSNKTKVHSRWAIDLYVPRQGRHCSVADQRRTLCIATWGAAGTTGDRPWGRQGRAWKPYPEKKGEIKLERRRGEVCDVREEEERRRRDEVCGSCGRPIRGERLLPPCANDFIAY